MSDLNPKAAWELAITGAGRGDLECAALPRFLENTRWFGGKGRAIARAALLDWSLPDPRIPEAARLLLLDVRQEGEGPSTRYFVPLRLEPVQHQAGPSLLEIGGRRWELTDALAEPALARVLSSLMSGDQPILMHLGKVAGTPTRQLMPREAAELPLLPVRLSAAEQSHSSLILGDRFMLKVFRRLESGINPECEIGHFLSERTDFTQIPPMCGELTYEHSTLGRTSLAVLQRWIANQGTGWEHALRAVGDYLERISTVPADSVAGLGAGLPLLTLAADAPPPHLERLIGDFLQDALLLGRRTAELHIALASRDDDPAFAPEQMQQADLQNLRRGLLQQIDRSLHLLRTATETLSHEQRELAQQVLGGEPTLRALATDHDGLQPCGPIIRIHGDYHLGQVLKTAQDYVILDFEGEPLRDLAERRSKETPWRDVVGMLRSFDYAANAGLLDSRKRLGPPSANLLAWTSFWSRWVSAAFLGEYLATTRQSALSPTLDTHLNRLVSAYGLQKAFYELQYEIQHRPAWVTIPLKAILALMP